MDLIRLSIRQPVTIAVGVILVVLAGFLALQRIPIQLTPNVEDTVIAVTTTWEGASPQEVEQEIVDAQEEKLQGIAGLKRITSTSLQGSGTIRLEFNVGTSKDAAMREVSDKLRQVPRYPTDVDEPVVEASDPDNRDYIAWVVFDCADPAVDVRTLQDFAEDRIKPVLERVPGISEINVLGGRERETQVRFDPVRLAQYGIPIDRLASAIQGTNENFSAGALAESSADVRLRVVSQYESIAQVEDTLVADTASGPVYVRDVAEVVETFKEATSFVRSRGRPVIAINAQREVGSNVMTVMAGLQGAVADLNAPGGLLDSYARQRGLEGGLSLAQVYDQTVYIDDALALVRSNIWIGGLLAIGVLLLFLRSLRSAGVIALSIPISVVGAVVFLVAMGRSVNVISLAGMAFAVGMVVDNAIVVLENVFRHLELGKRPMQAALDGAREVFGAVLAATLTTVVVFVPILLIQEEAGQLFRDIALAIVAAVSLSLVVSLTVIPAAAARVLKPVAPTAERRGVLHALGAPLRALPDLIAGLVYRLNGSVLARLLLVAALTAASLVGTWMLLPPADYLPVGNRNLIFGLVIPPPGVSLAQQEELGLRVEQGFRPYFEAGRYAPGTPDYEAAKAELPPVPTFDFATMSPGEPVVPPPLENYFFVSFPGTMFHGGIGAEPERVADLLPLFRHAASSDVLPGSLAFAFQVPLFQLGGSSGSAVEINFSGEDLGQVSRTAKAVFLQMMGRYGPFSIQPSPSNFDLPTPELQVVPDLRRLGEVGLTPSTLGLAVRALGDGAILGDYVVGSQTVDLKLIAQTSLADTPLAELGEQPIATPSGRTVPLSSVAELVRVNAPGQVNRTGRRRAVSLQFTPPPGMPLAEAIASVDTMLAAGRTAGTIPFDVATSYTGSASKLDAVKEAMLGDGTFAGALAGSLVLSLLVVYLLMCVLFQSFLRPLIILFSVPLATLGGFAGLYGVHVWSASDPYMPVQNLDILTMLGFVILVGVVVNNAILIVHQSINFMRGAEHEPGGGVAEPLGPREAIREAVRSRVRPIFMGTLTSVGGMSPLIFMPGAGSELYRGLGSVVVGGLLVSTVFTLLLVPLLLSLVSDLQSRLGLLPERRDDAAGGGALRTGAGVGTALSLLLLILLGPGCTTPPPPRAPVETIAAATLRERLTAVLDEERLRPPREHPTPPVYAAVAGRMDELEALGGPASYDTATPALATDLEGRAQGLAQLSLEGAVAAAAEHNLDLRLARIQADVDDQGVIAQAAAFDTVAFSQIRYNDAEQLNLVPLIDGFLVGTPESAESRAAAELGLTRLLKSGATVSMSTFLERLDNRTDVSGIDFQLSPNPSWRSGVTLGVNQPLLQGFGAEVTTAQLELSARRRDASEEDLHAELLFLVALVEQTYWDLEEAWTALRIRQHLADQGAEVERVLRERLEFDAGQAAYSDALATLQRRNADVLRAERLVRAASDNLKALMRSPDYPLAAETLFVPSDGLSAEAPDYQLFDVIVAALDRRPEVRRALLAIEDADLRERVAANARRARLDFNAEVSFTGLDDSTASSFDSLVRDDAISFLAGLTFEQPLGNRAARAAEEQARLLARDALIRYDRAVGQVILEVKDALRDVETSHALIEATRATRVAESDNLRATLIEEESRTRLTPEFLNLKFQRQERLALAQLREVEAKAGFNRALAAYYRAIGTGLRAGRLVLDADAFAE